MVRIPVKQVSYTLGCAHEDGHPIHILGSFYDTKREAKKALKKNWSDTLTPLWSR